MSSPKIKYGLEIKFGSEYGREEESAVLKVLRQGAPTSGAGGTVAILGRKEAQPALERIVAGFAERRGERPYVFSGSSAGADKFGVVVLNNAETDDSSVIR